MGFLLISFVKPNSSVPDFIEHRLYVPIIGILIILFKSDFLEKINNRWMIVDNDAPQRRFREASVAAATPGGKKPVPATGPGEASTVAAAKETAK